MTIDAVAMGTDKRVGLPLPRTTSSDSSFVDTLKDTALTTGRNVLGRVTPDGIAGDVTNAAADTAASGARSSSGTGERAAALVPSGTPFTLFLRTALD